MKQLVASILFFLIGVNGYAEENGKVPVTCFWMVEPEGDCTGETSRYTYHEEGFWEFFARNIDDKIFIDGCPSFQVLVNNGFFSSPMDNYWRLGFGIPGVGSFVPGIYKIRGGYITQGTQRPNLFIPFNTKELTEVYFDGELEILELEYEDNGILKAFAANFIQTDNDLPIMVAIRINSSIPMRKNNKRIAKFLYTLPSNINVPGKELFIEQSSLTSKNKKKWYSNFLDELTGLIFP